MGGYNFMGAIMGKPRVLNNYSEANGFVDNQQNQK